MRKTANALTFVIGMLVLSPMLVAPASAGVRVSFAYTSSPADVQVWLDRQGQGDYDDEYDGDRYEYDVYPSADDIVLYFRASRSCFATVYVVDTEGFIHVVHPYSIDDNAYIRGGRVYKIYLSDFGYGHGFDRGVAYAFAVSSPVPFDYSYYGVDIFGPGFGFRIYGDPYVASKRFYLSLIAGRCDRYLIGISHARFYVREYVRYPRYLCVGWHDYYGARQYCRGNCLVYRHYNLHARAPHQVLHPQYRIKHKVGEYTRIAHHSKREHEPRYKAAKREIRSYDAKQRGKNVVKTKSRVANRVSRKERTVHEKSVRSGARNKTSRKVVRSSKDSYVKGKG